MTADKAANYVAKQIVERGMEASDPFIEEGAYIVRILSKGKACGSVTITETFAQSATQENLQQKVIEALRSAIKEPGIK